MSRYSCLGGALVAGLAAVLLFGPGPQSAARPGDKPRKPLVGLAVKLAIGTSAPVPLTVLVKIPPFSNSVQAIIVRPLV